MGGLRSLGFATVNPSLRAEKNGKNKSSNR